MKTLILKWNSDGVKSQGGSVSPWIFLLGCLAFGIFWSAGLFVRSESGSDLLLLHYVARVVKILTCFSVALLAWRSSLSLRSLFCGAVLLLVLSYGFYSLRLLSVDLILMSEVLFGISYGLAGALLTLLFACNFSVFPKKYFQFGIFFSLAICHLVFLISLTLQDSNPTVLKLLASLIGPGLLVVCAKKAGFLKPDNTLRKQEPYPSLLTAFVKTLTPRDNNSKRSLFAAIVQDYAVVVLGAFILPLLYGMVAQIFTESNINAGLFDASFEAVATVVLLIAAFVGFLDKKPVNLDRLLLFAVPIIATALVVSGEQLFFAGMIVKCAAVLFHAAMWVVLARKAKGNLRLVLVTFGVAQGINHLMAILGRLLGVTLHGSYDTEFEMFLVILLLVIWMITLIAWWGLPFRKMPSWRNQETEISQGSKPGESSFEKKCFLFAEAYDLSQRETEVLQHFARGRSTNAIADMFTISRNTSKTHIRNIYIKAGIHSRQELLDTIEQINREEEPE